MKDSGKIIKKTVEASIFMLTMLLMRANGLMMIVMDLVKLLIKIILSMKDNLKMIK